MTSVSVSDRVVETYRSRTVRSAELYVRGLDHLPGGVTRSIQAYAPHPTYMATGSGCRITDVDGNEYLDLMNNYGALIHGHAHPRVVEAIEAQVAAGTEYGGPSEIQLRFAETLVARVPSLERVRFTPSGTEAVMYAIRVARAFTNRQKILKFEGCYHGGYDDVLVSVDQGLGETDWPRGTPASAGVHGADTLVAPFNNIDTTKRIINDHAGELAAVIVEPVMVRGMIPATHAFLRGLREIATAHELLLIVDEIVTFRLGMGGAQEFYGVLPDITVLGKLIGGGLPIGAVGGRADIMSYFDPAHSCPAHHSGTFAGNPVACAAGLVVLELFTPQAIDRLHGLGDRLRSGLQAALADLDISAQGTGCGMLVGLHLTDAPVTDYRSARVADREGMRWLHMALLNRGLFTRASGSYFLSTVMGESDIDEAVASVRDAAAEIRSGQPSQPS